MGGLNMYCESFKSSTEDYRNNWDIIFKRYYVLLKTDTPIIEECRKIGDHYQPASLEVHDLTYIKKKLIKQVFDTKEEVD